MNFNSTSRILLLNSTAKAFHAFLPMPSTCMKHHCKCNYKQRKPTAITLANPATDNAETTIYLTNRPNIIYHIKSHVSNSTHEHRTNINFRLIFF